MTPEGKAEFDRTLTAHLRSITRGEEEVEAWTEKRKAAIAKAETWARDWHLVELAENGITELPAKVEVFVEHRGGERSMGQWWLADVIADYRKAWTSAGGTGDQRRPQEILISYRWKKVLADGSMGKRDPGWGSPMASSITRLAPVIEA
jgi:hypothetical protein